MCLFLGVAALFQSWTKHQCLDMIKVETTFFLSDPSPIIGNACHSLTNSCLVNLIDVALACKDANSKLVEVVTVAHVDAEDHVGNSLLH